MFNRRANLETVNPLSDMSNLRRNTRAGSVWFADRREDLLASFIITN